MTDFDFDELDRAVNTVLGNDDEHPSIDTREVPNSTATSMPLDEPKVQNAEQQVVQKQERTAIASRNTAAPAMRRSSGRFMDVVHPSSDMRTKSAGTSRASTTPSPVSPTVAPAVPSVNSNVPTGSAQEVPDLLDDERWNAPLESPFLPNAHVEKRPLGGSAPTGDSLLSSTPVDDTLLIEEPDELRLEAPDTLLLEEPDPHAMPDPIDFAGSITETAENVPEMVEPSTAVESNDTNAEIGSAVPIEPGVSREPVNSVSAAEADLSHAAALDSESNFVPEAEKVVEAGPVSITQQYQEKPVSAEEPGSIYDTENYHQPITTPVKKKSGAFVVVLILLILIIGGGAGAAFYFYVLPML